MGVPLSYKYDLYYPNAVNNSMYGGFHFQTKAWIVLPEHLEFASTGFENIESAQKQTVYFTYL